MHVLIALQNEPYPFDGRVRQEAEALTAAGHTVTVCGPTGFGYDAPEEQINGVRVLRHPHPPAGGGVLGYLREYAVSLLRINKLMRRAAREQRVDVVLVCSPPDLLVLPALPIRRRGAALILDHHDLSPELFALKFGHRRPILAAVRAVERFALRRADVVLATNDTYAEVERRRGGVDADRIFVVRNGPDPARIYPVDPQPELKRGRQKLVCWIGMMSDQEGLHHVLNTADDLVRVRGRDDIGVAIVGSGDARDGLIAEAQQRGLADHVHFPGRVEGDLLRAYMSTADVCIGVDEPNPMNDSSTMTKVIEYMAMGRPIVQFPLKETARVCGDASLYARPGDAGHMAELIEELLDDPDRAAQLGSAGRERALADLLWPQQIPNLLEAVEAARRVRTSR